MAEAQARAERQESRVNHGSVSLAAQDEPGNEDAPAGAGGPPSARWSALRGSRRAAASRTGTRSPAAAVRARRSRPDGAAKAEPTRSARDGARTPRPDPADAGRRKERTLRPARREPPAPPRRRLRPGADRRPAAARSARNALSPRPSGSLRLRRGPGGRALRCGTAPAGRAGKWTPLPQSFRRHPCLCGDTKSMAGICCAGLAARKARPQPVSAPERTARIRRSHRGLGH